MNDFFDAFSKVPLSQKLLLLLLIMAAIFIGFYMFFFNTIEQKIVEEQEIQRELRAQQARRQQLDGEKARLEDLLDQEMRRRENLSFDQLLPPSPNLPGLIDTIESLAEHIEPSSHGTNLEILEVRPRPHVRGASYTRIPLELRMLGTYDQLLDFCWQVAQMDRIVHITSTSLSTRSTPRLGEAPVLRISIEIEAFFRG